MIRIYNYLQKNKLEDNIRMLVQVHDELIFEIKKGTDKKHILKIEELMENVLPLEESKGIKFEVNIKVGKNWGELKPLEPNGTSRSKNKRGPTS